MFKQFDITFHIDSTKMFSSLIVHDGEEDIYATNSKTLIIHQKFLHLLLNDATTYGLSQVEITKIAKAFPDTIQQNEDGTYQNREKNAGSIQEYLKTEIPFFGLDMEQQHYIRLGLTRTQVLDRKFNDMVKRGIENALKDKSLNQEQKQKKVVEAYEKYLGIKHKYQLEAMLKYKLTKEQVCASDFTCETFQLIKNELKISTSRTCQKRQAPPTEKQATQAYEKILNPVNCEIFKNLLKEIAEIKIEQPESKDLKEKIINIIYAKINGHASTIIGLEKIIQGALISKSPRILENITKETNATQDLLLLFKVAINQNWHIGTEDGTEEKQKERIGQFIEKYCLTKPGKKIAPLFADPLEKQIGCTIS